MSDEQQDEQASTGTQNGVAEEANQGSPAPSNADADSDDDED